jgi:hypothetical protein
MAMMMSTNVGDGMVATKLPIAHTQDLEKEAI